MKSVFALLLVLAFSPWLYAQTPSSAETEVKIDVDRDYQRKRILDVKDNVQRWMAQVGVKPEDVQSWQQKYLPGAVLWSHYILRLTEHPQVSEPLEEVIYRMNYKVLAIVQFAVLVFFWLYRSWRVEMRRPWWQRLWSNFLMTTTYLAVSIFLAPVVVLGSNYWKLLYGLTVAVRSQPFPT